jgi:VWFA-related protein
MFRFRAVAALAFAGLITYASLTTGQATQTSPGQASAAPATAAQVLAVQAGNTGTAPQVTVLHTNANLVLVDVVVTDHGKPVRNLDRKRFHLLENGKEQPISAFDEHEPSPVPADAAAAKAQIAGLPANTYTNIPVYPDAGVVNVLLLDALNTPMGNQAEARRQMIEYLGTIRPGTSLAIFTLTSQLRLVEGFTTDAARLTKVLKSKGKTLSQSVVMDTPGHSAQQVIDDQLQDMAEGGHPPSPEAIAALTQFETDLTANQLDLRVHLTMDALQHLARYLSAIQGRKNLIWFSGSFPISFDPDPDQALPFLAVRNYETEIRKTSELLTAARVSVYPIDARGLMASSTADAAYSPNQVRLSVNSGNKVSAMVDSNVVHDYDTMMTQTMQEHGSMQQIAQQTGGIAYTNDNDLKSAVASAVENGASFYTLGFAPGGKKLDGQFRRIQVRLDGGGYTLSYRRGYYADATNKPSSHNPGTVTALDSAALHGAPPATQVILLARVLPSTAPEYQGIAIPSAPAGEMAAALTGITKRYLVDMTVDPHTLAFNNEAGGVHQAQLEFLLMAYDSDGKRVNYVDRSYAINIKPDEFAERMSSGVRGRLALDLPAGNLSLRVVVEDLIAGRSGSLEVPVTVSAR